MFFRVGGEAVFATVVSRVGDLYIIVVFTLKKTSRVSDSWCLPPGPSVIKESWIILFVMQCTADKDYPC